MLLYSNCKEECDDVTISYNDNYLTAEQRSYIPLDKPEWDSIMYLKNGKDTITLYKKSIDSTSLYEPVEQYHSMDEPNYPNCNRVHQRYQNIKYTYRNDSTGDFMTVYLNLDNSPDVEGYNRRVSKSVLILFNSFFVEYSWISIEIPESKYFIGDFQQTGITYKNCFKFSYFNNMSVINKNCMIINLESIDKSTEYKLLVP